MQSVSKFDISNKISCQPYYTTQLGSAYLGNSLELMAELPDESVDLICTSPPFALVRKKEYGNVDAHKYVEWFKTFALELYRILKPQGSLVIDIGGTWLKGFPVRSLYHFELVIELCKPKSEGGLGFYLAQELFWYNPAKLPTPAEWVTVRRERVKDAVNTVWWLSKDPHPKANNKRVLRPYSEAMKNLLKNGYDAKLRPSGHDISTKFQNDRGGAIPPNIIADSNWGASALIGQPILGEFNWILDHDLAQPVNVISASNTASNDYYQRRCKEAGIKAHPARFPQALPEFAIALCTEPGDLVLDPFAGSNMTGRVAETLDRRWLAFELDENYLKASQFRFEEDAPLVVTPLKDRKALKAKALLLAPDYIKNSPEPENQAMAKQLELFPITSYNMPEQKLKFTYVYDILELDKDYIDEIYTLTSEQKYFLLAMLQMSIIELTKWNDIANYAVSVYKVRFPSKSFVKDIIQPLVEVGLIETEKTTGGRGAKPNLVKLSEKAQGELLSKLLESIADMTEISQTELNRSFEDVVNDLDHPDKHIKGKALELLAIWMIRLTSLRFTKWRKRDYETGQGEVDVLAASDRFVYHRWQIQCKNTKRVDVEVLAKEVGMTFVTGADVVMIVTTGEFTRDAFQYAYRMMEVSRYYMVLIQKEDIEAIKQDRTNIIKILDRRARRVFAKKELGLTDDAVDEIEIEEDSLTVFDGTLEEE